MSYVYVFADWFVRLLVLNLLWVVLTVIGLGIFGWLPATLTVIYILKNWLYQKTQVRSIKSYGKVYMVHLKKSQGLNAAFLIFGLVAYMDFFFFVDQSPMIASIGLGFLMSVCLALLVLLLYVLPIYSEPDVGLRFALKLGLSIGMQQWGRTLLTCLGLMLLIGIYYVRIDILLCFGMSLTLLWVLKTTKMVQNT
ncbi:DUF624 domain-containing protein [Fictibacillus halophilus]|nr:DUF624 domain-containing protein [Fictibacillus halophilus]